jgi:glycosyltransferase involved in cell wall biosynthesis
MISIIICSRNETICANLSQNIKNTIGCDYELIVIDNSEKKYSIFEAYNLGIEKSTYDYLCFLHDDILFHTKDWGNVVAGIFSKEPQIGLIGVAGTKLKTKMPSAWWNCAESQKIMHIIQHFRNGEKEKWKTGFKNNSHEDVVAIDGVFIAMRKDDNIRFSSEMKGFHNYDLNISFEYYLKGYKVIVTSAILIEHFSTGTLNEEWVDSTYKIYNLYRGILPLSIQKSKMNKDHEVANAIRFCNKCLEYNRNKMAITIWGKLFWMHPISKYHYPFLKRLVKNCLC